MADLERLAEETAELSRRLNSWRQGRRRGGTPIPEELWEMAAQLARKQGLNRTHRALHLHYNDLKRRVEALSREPEEGAPSLVPSGASASSLAVKKSTSAPTFVEWLAPMSATTLTDCLVEVESTRGSRMRVEMRQIPPAAIAAIIRDFAG